MSSYLLVTYNKADGVHCCQGAFLDRSTVHINFHLFSEEHLILTEMNNDADFYVIFTSENLRDSTVKGLLDVYAHPRALYVLSTCAYVSYSEFKNLKLFVNSIYFPAVP